jgi:hypothetical protein
MIVHVKRKNPTPSLARGHQVKLLCSAKPLMSPSSHSRLT